MFTSVVLYICVLLSLLLVFYVSQALFCISVCFPYYDFTVVLYIFVMFSLLLVFYVSQALFCISVLWFPCILCLVVLYICVLPYYWYFMSHKRCFVYLCYDFPIIGILCFTRLFCISVFCFPYYWYFMYHKRCFVYLCYDFPIIGILRFTSVVLYICVMISL